MAEHDTIADDEVVERLDAVEARVAQLEAERVPKWWWRLAETQVYDVDRGLRLARGHVVGHATYDLPEPVLVVDPRVGYDPEQLRALRGTGWEGDLDEMRRARV